MYRMLREKNEWNRERVVELASQLVSIPSPTLQESAVADVVEQTMRQVGYDKVVRDKAGNVVGILFGPDHGPTVVLNSHMDTVTPEQLDSAPPAHPAGTVADGWLFGCGAADCKGGLAAQILVADLLRRSLLPLKGNLVVAATVAEENGKSVGVRTLLDSTLPGLELSADYAILGEPTGLGLYYGHDGWMKLDIKIEGANPFQVDDAAGEVFRDFSGATRRSGLAHEGGLSISRPSFDDDRGMRRANLQLDRRLNSSESVQDVVRNLHHEVSLLAKSAGAVAVEVGIRKEQRRMYTGQTTIVRQLTSAWTTDPFHPLMERSRQALSAAECSAAPGKWQLGRLGMGTAGGMMVNEFHLPTIGYGPGLEEHAHTSGEKVEVEKLLEAIYGTTVIVHSLVGIPVFGWTADEI